MAKIHLLRHAIVRFLLALAAASVLASCSGSNCNPLAVLTPSPTSTPSLVSLSIGPPDATVPAGYSQAYVVTATYSNGTKQQLSAADVSWASSTPATAAMSPSLLGTANTLSPGTTMITATLDGISTSTTLNVTAAVLVSIEVTSSASSLAAGGAEAYAATGIYSDGSHHDLTSAVTWTSSASTVASVSNSAGSTGVATTVSAGSTVISATLNGITGSAPLTVTAATLVSIAVTPASFTLVKGLTQQYTATGTYSDHSHQNLTTSVTWSSSAATATIAATGLATGTSAGPTTISATLGALSGSAPLTVTAPTLLSINVTPANSSAPKGTQPQLTAVGVYDNGTTQVLTGAVQWSSSTPSVATVSNAGAYSGLASALSTGPTTITATYQGVTGSTRLTVTAAALQSIEVTPSNPQIDNGRTEAFTATGIYTDGTTQNITQTVTWSSSTPAVATISNAGGTQGIATAGNVGTPSTTTITATLGTLSGTATLKVTPATLVSIAVTPNASSIANGTSQQYTATGTYSDGSTQNLTTAVTWSSTAMGVATISNAPGGNGLATSAGVGNTTIAATYQGVTGSTGLTVTAATLQSIQVTPANPSIADGTSEAFTAMGVFSDGTTQNLTQAVAWNSSVASIAAVSNAAGSQGVGTGQAVGTTTISATLGGVSGSTSLNVTAATLVSIAVTPPNPTVADGYSKQFVATGTYSDNTTQNLTTAVTWSSSASAVASISNATGSNGLATSLSTGPSTITATYQGVSGSTGLTVTAATLQSIQVTPSHASIANGTSDAFTATGIYSDGTTQNITSAVTWSSTMSAANISNAAGSQGVATGTAQGSTTIQASLTLNGTTITGSTPLTITPATLASIAVTPANSSIPNGTSEPLTATGTYTDGSTQNLTTAVTWSSSVTGVATVSNAPGSNGLVSASSVGNSTLTATYQGVSGSTGLAVTGAVLQSITVNPSTASVAAGYTQAYTATGTYSDGSTQDLTMTATWSSSATSVATISNAAGSQGLATSVAPGNTTITATQNGISATATLNVTAAVLVSIAVTPATPTVFVGVNEQFDAIGTYSDGSTLDLTNSPSIVWSTPNGNTDATVSNASGTQGLLTPVTVGSTQVTATDSVSGISGSTTTVTVALREYAYVANHDANSISTYLIGNSGALTAVGITAVSSGGSQPFAIALDATRSNMYVTNIAGSDSLVQFSIGSNGSLTQTAAYDNNLGNSAYLTLDKNDNFLYVASLASNAINEYQIGSGGALISIGSVTASSPGFNSPYHLVVHPTNKWLYVLGAVSGNVAQYAIDPNSGALTYVSQIGIPGGGAGGGGAAMIPELMAIDSTGTHAFVSAQYNNDATSNGTVGEVMEYSIDPNTGNLTLVNTVSAGVYARSIVVDPTGRYVYVANVYSGSISEYTVDPNNGLQAQGSMSTGAGSQPSALNLDPTGQYLYVSLQGNNSIVEYSISGGTLTYLSSTTTGAGPDWVATGN